MTRRSGQRNRPGSSHLAPFLLVYFCLWSGSTAGTAAPPTVAYIFPAGAQRGTTVELTARGTFPGWPVQGWFDRSGVTVKAYRDTGKLSVSVAPDAIPGLYWLRLYDDQGASSPVPFIVGMLPELVEKEPNDDPKKPQVLPSIPVVVNGRLGRANDVDCFSFKLAKGQTLVASVEANRTLGSPMDAILQLLSADGFVVDENNDYHDLDPQIVYTARSDGTYIVRIFAFPSLADGNISFAGRDTFIYRLTLTTGGFVDHPIPLAVARSGSMQVQMCGWNIPSAAERLAALPQPGHENIRLFHSQIGNVAEVRVEPHPSIVKHKSNGPDHPQPITLPVTVSGRIDPAGSVDVYQFEAKKGQTLSLEAESRSLGFPLDPQLRLTDAAGKILAETDDGAATGEANRDTLLTIVVPQDGSYRIEVRDLHEHGGFRYVYRLRAIIAQPDYSLSLAANQFVCPSCGSVAIPVTVARSNGFAGAVDLFCVGLPRGIEAAPVKSPAKAAASTTVTLRLTAKIGSFAGPIRITGSIRQHPELSRTATIPLTAFQTSIQDAWLTVSKSLPKTPKGL